MVYVPYWFRSRLTASLVARGAIDEIAAAAAIRRVARDFDPEIAIARAHPLQQVVDNALASRRYQVTVFVVFAAVGFLIAMIGVYAMTADGISRRRREMNIRVALGASAPGVVALVVANGGPRHRWRRLGVSSSFGGSQAVAALVFEMSARDPAIVSRVAAIAIITGILSSLSAARQGCRSTQPPFSGTSSRGKRRALPALVPVIVTDSRYPMLGIVCSSRRPYKGTVQHSAGLRALSVCLVLFSSSLAQAPLPTRPAGAAAPAGRRQRRPADGTTALHQAAEREDAPSFES